MKCQLQANTLVFIFCLNCNKGNTFYLMTMLITKIISCAAQVPHGLAWKWAAVSKMRGQQLAAWAIALPNIVGVFSPKPNPSHVYIYSFYEDRFTMEETSPYSDIIMKDRYGVYGRRCVLVCGTLQYTRICGQTEEQCRSVARFMPSRLPGNIACELYGNLTPRC